MGFEDVEVMVEVCRKEVTLPFYANPGDAGMDVCAAEEVILRPGETKIVPTGLKLAIPVGYEVQVRPRSGLSLKTPLRISNSPGTIDSGYRDELGIIMTNSSENCISEKALQETTSKGNIKGSYIIKKGDRIAQLVLQRVPRMKLKLVDSVNDIGENRGGGFGSTGI
jgi:dUTP pyrophosphatase